jgi:transcriptional regulator with XRE-family HTH domain
MERKLRRKKLDAEMKPFRKMAKVKNPTNNLLRTIRQTLRFPVAEIAEKMGVCISVVMGIEERELTNTATVRSMARVAKAMGCKLVYGIVPEDGKTLDELAEERYWAEVLGRQVTDDRLQMTVVRERPSDDTLQIADDGLRVTADGVVCHPSHGFAAVAGN